MILLFPDTDTLKLALASSIVGPDVALAPAALTIDTQGRFYVEPTVSLSRTTMKNLDRIGVKGSKRHGSTSPEKVANWLQIVPLQKEAGTPEFSSQAPVLFELESADDLPVLVAEMLRLGNDKQSFRWFEGARVLLRVLGPPYYTLLRALDKTASGTKGSVRAYLERAPRVWVEIGSTHPFAKQIRTPEDQLLLLRSPRQWLFLEDAPFQDVYDILQFELPKLPVGWNETTAPQKMTVPLKLSAGNAADVPELWVLRDDALTPGGTGILPVHLNSTGKMPVPPNSIAQLDSFVRDADDRLLQRLTFAVASDAKGNRVVVLRTRPSKLAPPALPLENALGFKPFWKLPNLFLPAGKRLHPTLRRDAVRRLLADDPDQVVWLQPDGTGGFIPESVPDAAFRSLEDWVDYLIETNQEPLAAWIEATRFDFDQFLCTDPGGPKPKPPVPEEEILSKEEQATVAKPVVAKPTRGKPSASVVNAELAPLAEALPVSAWRLQREGLEAKFLGIVGPLDAPARQALWPKLATANAGEGSRAEAAICWLNALWIADDATRGIAIDSWAQAEFPNVEASLNAKELDRRLAARKPSVEELRMLVAGFLWLSQKPPSWLKERLPTIQKFFETHESSMPVRAVWLVAVQQAKLANSDVLGLAHVRDRLLLRLLEEGLRAERDLPLFLRYAGLKDSARLRVVRDKALELHQTARQWIETLPMNLPFVDLLFAFALAKLGEATTAKQLVEDARPFIEKSIPEENATTSDVANDFFFPAFAYRIEQALLDKPHRGPFPTKILDKVKAIRAKVAEVQKERNASPALKKPAGKGIVINEPRGRMPAMNPYWESEAVIDRLRQESRVFEPNEVPNPYRTSMKPEDPREIDLLRMTDIAEPKELSDRIRRYYKQSVTNKSPKEWRCRVLHEGLPLAPRVGEQFALELLNLVPEALSADGIAIGNPPTLGEIAKVRGELIDRALVLAAQYGQVEFVQKIVNQFTGLIRLESDESRFAFINFAIGQCLRNLKKLGMPDQIDRLLTRVQAQVFPEGTVADLRERYAVKPESWLRVLQTLLHMAGGWLMIGQSARANEILDAARAELFAMGPSKLAAMDITNLALAYIAALGHGPSESGIARIKEFFTIIPATRILSPWTGARTYSRQPLKVIEEVVHAVISDEFALGPVGRKWLDDDEYIVRNRIHADMYRLRVLASVEA